MKKSTVGHFFLISRPPLSGMMQPNEIFGLARNCNSVILARFQYMDYAAETGIRFSNNLAFHKWSTHDAFYWYRLEKNSSACAVMVNICYLFWVFLASVLVGLVKMCCHSAAQWAAGTYLFINRGRHAAILGTSS